MLVAIHRSAVDLREADLRVQIRHHSRDVTFPMVAEVLPFHMKIVVDTNVLVGACLGTGTANGVLAACLKRQCVPLIGNALFAEYEDVFGRHDLFENCKLSGSERNELLDVFFACCEWTRVYYLWRPNLPDESDNHLVELAVAGGADFIVTRNLRHLRNAQLRFPELRIASPGSFLKEL
jgi:putative PIN family toxin of toxin-antitoxin system